MDEQLKQLKDTYKEENDMNFSKTDAEQVFHKITDKNQSKSNIFHPFRIALTLAAALLIGFLFLSNLNDQPLPTSDSIQTTPPTVEGYVVSDQYERALIVNSDTEIAYIYLEPAQDIQLGQKIQGWHEGELESGNLDDVYGVNLEEYNIVNNEPVDDSNLTEAEAIGTALIELKENNNPLDSNSNFYTKWNIKSVNYLSEDSVWEINITSTELNLDEVIKVNDESGEIIEPESSAPPFNHNDYGEQFEELEQDLTDSINNPGTILNRIASANEEQGKDLLNGAAIDENGTVTIDFQPFEMSLASAELGEFSTELKDLAFAYDQTNEIYIQFNGNRENAYEHLGIEIATLTEDPPPFEELLQEYESTFRELAEGNHGALDFESMDEVKAYFKRTMSDELAEIQMDNHIREEEDGIYINPTEFPIFIDLEDEYEINQMDDYTYHVVQEHQSDLRGHIEVTFIIKERDNKWLIDDVEVEQIEN